MRDYYQVLQVDPSAEVDVIGAAYRVLARKLHPDSGRRDAERMTELNQAYAVLRDPLARARYDRDRALGLDRTLTTVPEPDGARYTAPSGGRLDFGRYEGWTLREVAQRDIDYLRWLSRHASGARYRQEIAVLLHQFDPPRPARPRR